MNVYRIITMLAAAALLWCCNGEDTLLDLYPMEPIVNPEVGMLIGGNGIIHADFDGRQQISGVTGAGIFTTADRFQSLDFEPSTWQATDGVVTFGDGIIVHAQANDMSFALRYSMDQGKTWAAYGEALIGEHLIAAGKITAVQLLVAADRAVWVLCQQGTREDAWALLYRVELEQQRSTLIMVKAGATALAFGFVDTQHGWVLCGGSDDGTDRVDVLRTENGGRTWTEGAVLDDVVRPAVTPITADDLLVYSQDGAAFHSADGGISFEPVAVGGRITACQAATSSVIYASLESGVTKSVDGGRTWTALDAVVHGVVVSGTVLDFHGERTGIVYGADRLFMTDNGGQSWDVLVYPYDYVFGDGDEI